MGKGGSSGGSKPKLDYTDLWGVKSGLQNLTAYENGLVPVGSSLGNWAFDLATGGNAQQGVSQSPLWFSTGPTTYPSFGGGSITTTEGQRLGGGPTGGGNSTGGSNLLGPFLSNAWNYAMPNEQGMQSELSSLFGSIGKDQAGIENVLNNTGLNPQQQAYVDQATSSGKAAVQQQLASEGLTGSTSNAMLQNQVEEAGAATAGQLIQGNEQLGLEGQQLIQQSQQLGLNTEEAQFAQQAAIFSQSAGLQNQLFNQGLEGYQLSNQMINTSLQGYNSTLASIQADNQDRLATAQLEDSIASQENQASASGFSSLLGGLGTLFGSSSSTGGLMGSLFGSALGGTGSGAIGGIISAISGAFTV